MFPALRPSMMRERKMSQSVFDSAKIKITDEGAELAQKQDRLSAVTVG